MSCALTLVSASNNRAKTRQNTLSVARNTFRPQDSTAMPMEAWLHGAATTAQVSPVLKNLLDGLASVPPYPVYERLLCLASPPSTTGSRSEVLLIRDLSSPHSTWCARLSHQVAVSFGHHHQHGQRLTLDVLSPQAGASPGQAADWGQGRQAGRGGEGGAGGCDAQWGRVQPVHRAGVHHRVPLLQKRIQVSGRRCTLHAAVAVVGRWF